MLKVCLKVVFLVEKVFIVLGIGKVLRIKDVLRMKMLYYWGEIGVMVLLILCVYIFDYCFYKVNVLVLNWLYGIIFC